MTSSNVPEHLVERVHYLAEKGRSVKEIAFDTRLSGPTIEALLRDENPDTSMPDEGPLFPSSDQQAASS